jgi:flagellin-like hook-associated protein FlgL
MTRNITNRYAAPFAGMVPGFLSNVNRATTGLGSALGLDMRSTSEKAQEALSGLELTDPQSVQNTVQMLRNVGLGSQAAQILGMSTQAIQEQEQAKRKATIDQLAIDAAEQQVESQQRYREIGASQLEGTKYDNYVEGIRNGSVPIERMELFLDEINEEVDPIKLDLITVLDKDGRYLPLHSDGYGNYFALDGSNINPNIIDRPVDVNYTGDARDLGNATERQMENLLNTKSATMVAIGETINLINDLQDSPNANTAIAKLSGNVADIGQEMRALFPALNENLINLNSYSGYFDELNIQSQEMRSKMFGLALRVAAATGLGTGRSLTDKDIENALRMIGANRSDPGAIINNLESIIDRLENAYQIQYEVVTGNPFTFNLDPRSATESSSVAQPGDSGTDLGDGVFLN